jgi:CubicO group peptidase (beta-lactamase class C family)
MKKTTITIFALLALLVSGIFAQKSAVEKRIEAVENNLIPFVPVKGFKGWNIAERMKYYKVPGVSVAVIKDFKIDWAKGYGLADVSKNKRVTTETMFSAGSISKLVMAAAALNLVEEGKIDLDTPINNYLTSWKIAENDFTRQTPVTLRMLLSHTAGTSQASYFGFTPDKDRFPNIVEILSGAENSEARSVVVNSEPKKEFRYSGGGSMIAQLALMDVSKQSFEDLTQATIFQKLGMKNSTFAQPLPAKYSEKAAWAYSNASWFKGMPYVYPQQAAAGLYSTPTDLAKFMIDVQKSYRGDGKILKQNSAKEMMKPQADVSDGSYKEQIAVGPFLFQRTDNREEKGIYFEFTGVNAGFLAYAMANLTTGDGVVIMLNSGDDVNGLGKEIRRSVAKTYGWYKFLPEEITPINLSAAELDQYVGRYRRGADEVVYIRRENNYLVENINNGNDIYVFPVAKDTIVFTDYNVKGTFGRNEKGNVISLKSDWQPTPMPRMRDDEFTPSEYLNAKKYAEAKEGFRQMKLNEYQITYLAYELAGRKPADTQAVKTVLELALEQHPKSAIVHARWGDFYLSQNDKPNAIKSFQKAVEFDPNDKDSQEKLNQLSK